MSEQNVTERVESLALIDLDAQAKPVAQVRLFGNLHNLMPLTMGGFRALRSIGIEAKGDEGAQIEIMRGIIRDVMPTLADADAQRLDLNQLMTIVTRAAVTAEKVESIIRAAEGKEPAPVAATVPTAAPEAPQLVP